jgi:hypothetical protein
MKSNTEPWWQQLKSSFNRRLMDMAKKKKDQGTVAESPALSVEGPGTTDAPPFAEVAAKQAAAGAPEAAPPNADAPVVKEDPPG